MGGQQLVAARCVWKYRLDMGDTALDMPSGAEVLCAQVQGGHVFVWVLVDPLAAHEQRHFLVVGTGGLITHHQIQFVGTVQFPLLEIVLHIFEVGRR
jgi:hypothetical protein